MFAMLTELNASSRVMCYQFAPYLKAVGIKTTICSPSSKILYQLCNRTPVNFLDRIAVALLYRFYWYLWAPLRRLVFISSIPLYDVIFIQRGMLQHCWKPWLEMLTYRWAKIWRKKVIYAFDDPIYLDCPTYMKSVIEKADAVFTYAEALVDYSLQYNPKVFLLEPGVDLERYPLRDSTASRKNRKIVIGWVGNSMVGFRYLKQLYEPLRRLFQKYPNLIFRVVSGRDFRFDKKGVPVENVRWRLDYEASATFDIGLIPLTESDYDKAKISFKLLQYWAHGIPVVCSQTADTCLEDEVNCLIVKKPEDWVEKLSLLIEQPTLRKKLGDNGRRLIETRFSLEVQGMIFANCIKDVVEGSIRLRELEDTMPESNS